MSSPFVAGIVALLLEANDTLNVTQVKEILATTARTDSLTGTIPPGGSNLWGWGKVDALAAIQELETYSTEDILKNNRAVQIFPNPTSASITVFFENKKEDVMIQITDISGKLVWSENWSDGCDYAKNIDLSSFKAGIYFLSLRDNENIITSKIVKY
ncbi:MAG: T9SS type A sorting domain-containing protein [Bacteroidetes bacterium]|nr:T9SS type A sorting domain-containing protein [Bacteroidota bacterium]